jgi:hypothetical protein
MKKCIVNVIYRDGQEELIQVDYIDSIPYTEYRAFDKVISHKVQEIKFVRMVG